MKTVEKLRIVPIGTIVSVADRTLRIYSKACMAHLRPDHESVVFAKTRET